MDLYSPDKRFMWSGGQLYQWAQGGGPGLAQGWVPVPYALHNNKVYLKHPDGFTQADWTGFWFHYDAQGRLVVTMHAWTGTNLPHPPQAAPRQAPAPAPARQRPGAAQRPAQRPAQQGWTAMNGHAYRGNVDLGLLVNDHQVVQPTNGGRLWALYDLRPDGTLSFVGRYGQVAGAPPPPNAAQNQVPQQMRPPPPPPPAYAPPPPVYVQPAPVYVPAPIYGDPNAPPVYAAPPPPVYVQPAPIYGDPNAPLGGTPGIPGFDPVTGLPLTPAQAAYQGAAAGAAAAAEAQAAAQAQADALTQSILMGGGVGGGFGLGEFPGFDASTLAMLSGGDGDVALQLALANGGYDPTAGGMVQPYY